MGKGTFSIEGITSNSVQVLLVPDTTYESYRVIVVDEETGEEFNEYSSSLSITVSGLSPSTDYTVNVIGQINGQGDASVGWWGSRSFTTLRGSIVNFYLEEIGSRYITVYFEDDDRIGDYVRIRIAKYENDRWNYFYTSGKVEIIHGEAYVSTSNILTPNTKYRVHGQYGELQESGYTRWRSAYWNGGYADTHDFTTKKGGIVHIYTDNEWKEAIPYIYTNGEWKEAAPYIYFNGWKQTI